MATRRRNFPGWLEYPGRTAILRSKPWEAILATRSQPRFWRQLATWVALYALILQTLLVGVSGPARAGNALADQALCLHDGEDTGALPGEGPAGEHDPTHCLLCIAIAYQALLPARMPAPALSALAVMTAFWPVTIAPADGSVQRLAHRTRAPPIMA